MCIADRLCYLVTIACIFTDKGLTRVIYFLVMHFSVDMSKTVQDEDQLLEIIDIWLLAHANNNIIGVLQ